MKLTKARPRRCATPSWPGDLAVFFALRLVLVLPGFLDANERQPRLGGDHDVGHVGVAGAL